MSKIFSLIGLETNTGIRDVAIMGGIPKVEDIQNSRTYQELVEDCGSSEYISVVVQSFQYGNGPPEPAVMEDLQWIGAHHEIIENGEAVKLQTARFAILYPDQGMQMNM
jgi:hypothetical protein